MAELVTLGAPVDQALASVREDLAEGGITSWDRSSESDRNAAVAQTLKVSLKQLDSLEQELYQQLAVFPEDEPVPLEVAAELWGLAGGATRRLVMKLASASLLEFDLSQGRLRLHDVLRTWLVLSMGKEALQEAHAALIGRWGNLRDLAQARVPAYAWRWIGYHLREAGRLHQLDGLLQDLGWLQAKLNASGIAALERDFDYASDQPELGRLRHVLRNASHVLASHPQQLPSQLLARLPSRAEDNAVSKLRRQSRDWIEKDGGGLPLTETLLSSEALLRTFAHGTMVCTLAVFPDGRLASGSHNGAIRIWNPDTGDCKITLKDPAEWLRCLAVLTDDRLASGYWDGSIRIWNLETGICESTLKGTSEEVRCLPVLSDGRLASGSGDGSIRIWSLDTGVCETTLESPSKTDVQCLAVLSDGRLASGSGDGSINVWNPISEIREDTLDSHTPFGVSCLASLADGRLISGYSIIKIWDLSKGSFQILDETQCSDGFLAVLSDGRIATSSIMETIKIWNLDQRICETTLEATSVSCLAALPDGRLASGSLDGRIRIWDMETDRCEASHHGHSERVNSLSLLQDGRVVSASADGKIKCWDPTDGTCEATIRGLTRGNSTWNLTGLAVLPDGHIVCGGQRITPMGCIIWVWNPTTGACTATFEGPQEWVGCLVGLSEGRLASASDDGTLQVWEVATGRCTATLRGQEARVTALEVLPSGQLAAASSDQKIRLWDPESPDSVSTLEVHTDFIISLAALPDGRLATADVDGFIRILDPATGVWHHPIKGFRSSKLVSLRDGRLVAWSQMTNIRIWNPNTGACETILEMSSESEVKCLVVLTDGRLASGSGDGSIRIWNLETGICDTTLLGHSKDVSSIALLSDDRLASASSDGTIRVLDIETQSCTMIIHCNHQPLDCLVALSDGRLACGTMKRITIDGSISSFGVLSVWDHERRACIK